MAEVKLKEFRQKHKISQAQAGESIGIEQRQWSRYEQGKTVTPVKRLGLDLPAYRPVTAALIKPPRFSLA